MSNNTVQQAKIFLQYGEESTDNGTDLKTKYRDFTLDSGKYFPNISGNSVKKLKPGSYSLHFDQQRNLFWFEHLNITNDEILDLPSPEYDQIVKEMHFFMKPETKQKFKDKGFVYKRSTLLHGLAGTGKTIIANRIAKDIINNNGIVLWVTNPATLVMAFDILKDIQPETLTGVILEEFDSIIKSHGQESLLLTLLDGQVQKQNVIYLATTNYIEQIPKRLYRPGRFSSVIEVNYPTLEARTTYLENKLGKDFEQLNDWAKNTNGLSIDELKEMVQSVYILNNDFDFALKRILSTKGIIEENNQEITLPLRKGLLSGFYNE